MTVATVRDRAGTWWTIFRIALEERLVYRGDFALGTLMRFLPIITQIFLWWAVFETIGSGSVRDAQIVGYAFPDMVAYYLLTMLSRAFSSMPSLSSGIALQIRDGEIKKYLVQPVDFIGFLLITRIAHKTAYYSVAVLPFAFVFYLCRGYFIDGWPAPEITAAFVLSLLMGLMLGFFLETCIGLIGFWFLEVTSLLFIYMLMSFFLSGHMFPLDMLDANSENLAVRIGHLLVEWLPLKFLAYFPAAVFLEKVQGAALVRGLLLEAAWLVFFIVLSRVLFARGLKRYSGYGG